PRPNDADAQANPFDRDGALAADRRSDDEEDPLHPDGGSGAAGRFMRRSCEGAGRCRSTLCIPKITSASKWSR
ncbi:MAG: hypothetical protein WBC59_10335, partial [Phycisphaerae bacterium]